MKQSGQFIKHIPCIRCPSSDGLGLYQQEDGSVDGYCWACKTPFKPDELLGIPIKTNNKKRTMHSPSQDIEWVEKNSAIMELPERGLNKESVEYYGIRARVSETTGEITHHYYPMRKNGVITAYKEKCVADKSFRIIGDGKGCDLFGEENIGKGGKFLIITEGELDAPSAHQICLEKDKRYRIVSLPYGANIKSIGHKIELIDSFDTIMCCFDQDQPGQEAAADLASILQPGKVKVMKFSLKDANDMLMAGKSAEFFSSIFSASTRRPDGIVGVEDVFDEAIKPVEWGLSWPWPTLTKATYGYRRKELYGFGAGSGSGKTEGFKEIINHVIEVHKLPAGVIFLEEPVAKTLKVLAGKRLNKRFHVPDGDWEIQELVDGINHLKGKVYLYNHFGSKDWEGIKAKIRYMVKVLGIKDIFLDHLTALVAQENDEYKALNRIMEEMSSLTQELDCTIFYISHLRKANGTPHEEGGRVSADQFKGSGAIVFWSNFLFGYERNQQATDAAEKNTTTFRVLKDRNLGIATGLTFQLWYNHENGRWQEKEDMDGFEEL